MVVAATPSRQCPRLAQQLSTAQPTANTIAPATTPCKYPALLPNSDRTTRACVYCAGSLFGATQTSPAFGASTGGLFGSTPATTGSLFGGSTFGAAPATGGGLFSAASAPAAGGFSFAPTAGTPGMHQHMPWQLSARKHCQVCDWLLRSHLQSMAVLHAPRLCMCTGLHQVQFLVTHWLLKLAHGTTCWF